MALSQIYTAIPNDVISAARWNNEFGNIYNNGTALVFPVTQAVSFAGFTITLDSAGATTLSSSATTGFSLTPGAKSGTPNTTGKTLDIVASTFTDTNTAGSGTATAWAGVAIQQPTLAAANASVACTDAATLYIANAPLASTNETITNPWSLWVDDGACRFDGVMGGVGFPIVNEFRLSLTTGVPVTTADVSAAGTIYLTPYVGSHFSVFSGSQWKTYSSAQISLALTATSGKPYDVFVYDNAGTLTLEILVWTNDTTRATALAYQNGVLVKSGDVTRRYVGSFYATGANVTEDSEAKRNLYNYYNRIRRGMRNVVETANTWAYNTATWRQANANAANQLELMVGVSEDLVHSSVKGVVNNNAGANVGHSVGIGVDSTSADSSHLRAAGSTSTGIINLIQVAEYNKYLAEGRHTLVWLERSINSGTTAWLGDNNDIYTQTGIHGACMS